MSFLALQNLNSAELILNAPAPQVAKMIRALGQDQAELLLHHFSAEQNRRYFFVWEQVQIWLALGLAVFLYLATQRKIFPLALCGIMLALVLFQHIGITPELSYRGRETDFPPGNAAFGAMKRVLILTQLFIGTELVKLVTGGILVSYLVVFRARKRSTRRDVDLVDDADHSHIDG
jgi:hypothetical protein